MPTIAECVEPLRTSAMDRAEQFAREYADRLLADLAACGGDAEVFAPYPKNNMGRGAYLAAQLKYGLVRRLTNPVKSGSRSPRDPDFRVPNPVGVGKFVEEARQDADRQYSAFIAKLESKIGPHSDATLHGDHVWSYSVLTVETPTGRQDWKTQQILNVSKLGKVFNQWPTRLVGAAKAAAEAVQAEPVAEPAPEVALIAEKDSGREALEGELAEALAGKADGEAKGEAMLIGFYSARVEKLRGRLHRLTGNPVKLYDATFNGRPVKVTVPEE
jgi:hypothetical protein